MGNPIESLKERVLFKRGKNKETELTAIVAMVRELSCLGEIIGRDFEVRNPKGELVYTIHQKPMAIKQFKLFLKEFITLKKLDDEKESKKWGGKGSPKTFKGKR